MTALVTSRPSLADARSFAGPQDHGRDLLRPILLIAEPDLDVLAHLALDRLDRPLRSQHPLIAGRLADEQSAVFGQADKRRQNRIAVLLEDDGLAVRIIGDFAIGRSQVDTDDRLHDISSKKG